MEFESTIAKLDSSVWNMHLTVPQEVSDHFLGRKVTRIVCDIEGRHSFHAALMPKGKGTYFININKDIRKKLGLREGDKVQITLVPDESKYGIHIAEEMQELLNQDVEGSHLFHQLTMGKQRTLIHIASSLKSSDGRLRKALMILDYLKSVNGQLDFKELNTFMKENRERYY